MLCYRLQVEGGVIKSNSSAHFYSFYPFSKNRARDAMNGPEKICELTMIVIGKASTKTPHAIAPVATNFPTEHFFAIVNFL